MGKGTGGDVRDYEKFLAYLVAQKRNPFPT
jgi:hypothetical protein